MHRIGLALLVSVLISGCQPQRSEPNPEKVDPYDAVTDTTRLWSIVVERSPENDPETQTTIYLDLHGTGIKPQEWTGSLVVKLVRNASNPPLLTKTPQCWLGPEDRGLAVHRKAELWPPDGDQPINPAYRGEAASVAMPLEDLIRLVTFAGRIQIDDFVLTLTHEEIQAIRTQITAARAISNGR